MIPEAESPKLFFLEGLAVSGGLGGSESAGAIDAGVGPPSIAVIGETAIL